MARKLIEVALPLETINRESAREKSIRHGHPATLHLWWARRPLATCRAVLFAQLVDDPSAHPDRFPTEEARATERRRLFDIIERFVDWDNSGDARLMRAAHDEIAACFGGKPPDVLDPFSGGGSIPLEAHRLGLIAHARDLNPVAVLLNKALIEFAPAWQGASPVFPGAAEARMGAWHGSAGLAEDVRHYGAWIRQEAERRIGSLYPDAARPDGGRAPVIAWLWARTLECPNPACGASLPLIRSLWLSKSKARPTWLRPNISNNSVSFEVVHDRVGPAVEGTVGRQGGLCLVCSAPVPLKYIRQVAQARGLGQQLIAVIAEGHRQRAYLPATPEQVLASNVERPDNVPEAELPKNPRDFKTANYGMRNFADLFTNRQLVALVTLAQLVGEARGRAETDALAAGLNTTTAAAYADAVSIYLALAVGRCTDYNSSICTWHSGRETIRNTFARQAIPMTWDYVESNILGDSTGNFGGQVAWIAGVLRALPVGTATATVDQQDAQSVDLPTGAVVCTDPPYYDNIGYADLADFFYVWLRQALYASHPDLFATVATPKREELVATPYRFGGSAKEAEKHFEAGFLATFTRIREQHRSDVPIVVFYAFKQAEEDEGGVASTGWETMLNGLVEAGLGVTATWPMRSELSNRMLASGTNALASSIVLACRPREATAEVTTRRGFIQGLRLELPNALREMQQGSLAPVDLAQASIGPGMAIFTRYRQVIEADGTAMTVRTALALINQALDEVLASQETDFDSDTRFCVKWFTQFAWNEADFGHADQLSRSTNTSVDGLVRGGIFWARAGRARLLSPEDLQMDWNPAADERVSVWEAVVRLAKALEGKGSEDAARLMADVAQRVDLDAAKELAYLLFSVCDKRGWTESALLFNGLGTSWSDLSAMSRAGGARTPPPAQGELDYDETEG